MSSRLHFSSPSYLIIPYHLITTSHMQSHPSSHLRSCSHILLPPSSLKTSTISDFGTRPCSDGSTLPAHTISLTTSHTQKSPSSLKSSTLWDGDVCPTAPSVAVAHGTRYAAWVLILANSLNSLALSPHRMGVHLASALCNALEHLISSMHSHTLHTAQCLQGNFAPVTDECPPLACSLDEYSSPLPSFLEGVYVRNGPNEQYKSNGPATQGSHPFDGDGMLHSVSFRDGKLTYCCRYVHTSRFTQEKTAGQALFPKIFSSLTIKESFVATAYMSLAALRHVLGLVDLSKGMGLANTSVVFHHGKLLALGEDDLPYALRIESNGDLLNIGRYTFSGNDRNLPMTMTSHPKIDPVTGEMIFLSYNAFFQPYLTFSRVSLDGILSKPVPITLEEPSMIHDFAITPHYIIFPETQLVFHPLHMVQGKAPIKCDERKVQRFGVLPRDATDDSGLRWFDVPGCNCFHMLNAWEEEEEENINIVLILPNFSSPGDLLSGKFDGVKSILTEVRLNLTKGEAKQRALLGAKGDEVSSMNVEMGTMNEKYRGVKNRYVYMGVLGRSSNILCGLVKVDLKTREVVACRMFDEGCFASEPMFVPSLSSPDHAAAYAADVNSKEADQEDEGCLICFLHRESPCPANCGAPVLDDACRMLVLDAQSPTLDIISSIKLPRRVPYGFHGLFIPDNVLS